MHLTRRQFTKAMSASAAFAAASAGGSGFSGGALRLGLNTYSLRSLPHDTAIGTVIRTMKDLGMTDCQLWSGQVEPRTGQAAAGSRTAGPAAAPTPQQMEERRAGAAARTEWRLSVPLSHFEAIRCAFAREGLEVRAYATAFSDSAAEVDRLFLMAKTLGAQSVNGRVAAATTDLVAAAGRKHGLRVGIQVADVTLLEEQLRASPVLRADPDAGDLTRAGVDVLDFVQKHSRRIDCLDLKDAVAATGSVPFGEGDAGLRDVVRLITGRRLPITAYIDCDYPGTGDSVEEVARCTAYIRRVQAGG